MRAGLSVCWESKRRKRFPLHASSTSIAREVEDGNGAAAVRLTDGVVHAVDAFRSFVLQNLGIIWTDVKDALRFAIVLASIQPASEAESAQDRMRDATMQVLQACPRHGLEQTSAKSTAVSFTSSPLYLLLY